MNEGLTMLCRGCGAKISFIGKVCPHCQRDKTDDARHASHVMAWSMSFAIGGGLIGYLANDGFLGQMAGLFAGGFLLGAIGMVIGIATAKPLPDVAPPEVRISSPKSEEQKRSDDNQSIENRLAKLESLRASELISDEEYAKKRAEILSTL